MSQMHEKKEKWKVLRITQNHHQAVKKQSLTLQFVFFLRSCSSQILAIASRIGIFSADKICKFSLRQNISKTSLYFFLLGHKKFQKWK